MYEIAIWGFVFFWQKNLRMSNFCSIFASSFKMVNLFRLLVNLFRY